MSASAWRDSLKNWVSQTHLVFFIKVAWQVVGFSFLFLLKNNGTENLQESMASIQLIFKSGSIPVSDIGCSAKDRKSKGAEICTCPSEGIEEALGTKGTRGGGA